MRQIMPVLLACAALGGMVPVTADEKTDETSDRARVVAFLKKNVIGKTVATPKTTFKLDNNKLEGELEDRTTFNNFSETAEGCRFDMASVSKETRYDLDKNGKRVGLGRDISGTSVLRYELCERASTKKLTGTARYVSTTMKHPNQDGTVILVTRVKITDGKLSWDETMPGYGDFTAPQGKYKPGSFDGKLTFSIAEGKLRIDNEYQRFDVDPDTLKRTPQTDKVPPFVSKEIEQK